MAFSIQRWSACTLFGMLGWGGIATGEESVMEVEAIPLSVRQEFDLNPFYQKCIVLEGFPIVSSSEVSDFSILEAAYLIRRMLKDREDILAALARNNVRFTVMAWNERTTDVPEHSDLEPPLFWDRRARGLGATRARPSVSCGEENLLGFPGDPYRQENILIHEFAHAVHEMAMRDVDPTFDERLQKAFRRAKLKGIWKGAYAESKHREYFAEGVQSWYDTNRENDNQHNHIDTREELLEEDPLLAKLVQEVFPDDSWRYAHPADRKELEHLEDFDPGKAPIFAWSEEEEAAKNW
ncbi:MAG: hypothetical protein AAGJ79_08145 [Verrucomicrobiota bacterium]